MIDGQPYHFEPDGTGTLQGFFGAGSYTYYSLGQGKLATGLISLNKKEYNFDSYGRLINKKANELS